MQSILQRRAFTRDPFVVRLAEQHDAERRRGSADSSASSESTRTLSGEPTETPRATDPATRRTTGADDVEKDAGAAPATRAGGDPGADVDPKERKAARQVAKAKDQFLVEFEPGSTHDPHNWSSAYRWFVTIFVAHVALVVGVAASINSGAEREAAEAYGVSEELMRLDTAIFLIGFGVASPLMGPLSELAGRSPVYLITLLFFVLFEIGTACSTTFHGRIILRFFAGFAGSTPLSNAGGSLADLWSPEERTVSFAIFANAGFLGPTLGPVIGSAISDWSDLGFQWCDWISAIWGGLVLLLSLLFLPETFAPVLLKFKSQQTRKLTGDERYMSALERVRQTVPFKVHFVEALARPFMMLIYEPIVLFFSLYMSVVYIILFGDLISFPYVYDVYGLSTGLLGCTFIPIAIGLFVLSAVAPIDLAWYRRALARARRDNPERPAPPPEERLRLAMYGTWLVPISLLWMGWTCYASVPIWAPLASQIVFGAGILAVFIASYQFVIDAYLSTAASALSTLTLVRYPISGAAVMFTGPMFEGMGRHWALTFLALLSLVCCAIPFVFYRWGAQIRRWSRYTPRLPGEQRDDDE